MSEQYVADTPEMIKQCLGCTRSRCVNCYSRARDSGTPPVNLDKFKWDPPTVPEQELIRTGKFGRQVYALYRQGYTDKEIAGITDRSQPYVTKVRNDLKLPRITRSVGDALRYLRKEGKI